MKRNTGLVYIVIASMVCVTVLGVHRMSIEAEREKQKLLLVKEKERPLKIWEHAHERK